MEVEVQVEEEEEKGRQEEEEIAVLRALDATTARITRRIRKIICHLLFYHRRSNLLFIAIPRLVLDRLVTTGVSFHRALGWCP